jgi:hypothetical protein
MTPSPREWSWPLAESPFGIKPRACRGFYPKGPVYLHAGVESTTAIAGGPPRGPNVSITAETPAL